jgi:hypothetical protein
MSVVSGDSSVDIARSVDRFVDHENLFFLLILTTTVGDRRSHPYFLVNSNIGDEGFNLLKIRVCAP